MSPTLFAAARLRVLRTIASLLVFASIAPVISAQESQALSDVAAASELHDPALLSLPQTSASDDQQRKNESLALFGKGRLLERSGEYPSAIAAYQKAWVLHPESEQILARLVPVCFRADLPSVGYRYGSICLARGWSTVAPLRGIAFHSILEDPPEQAWLNYERAIAAAKADADDDALLGLHYDRLRMAYLNATPVIGLPSAEFLVDAMAQPEKFAPSDETKEELWGQESIIHSLIAEVFLANGKYESAERSVRRAAQQSVDGEEGTKDDANATLPYELARIREKQNRLDEARVEIQAYLDSNSQEAGVDAWELYERVSQLNSKALAKELGDRWEASSSDRDLGHFLADFHLRHGQYEQALVYAERLAEMAEDSVAQMRLLAAQIGNGKPGPIVASLGRITKFYGNLDLVEESLKKLLLNETQFQQVIETANQRCNDKKRPILWNECLGVAFLGLAAERNDVATDFVAAGKKSGKGQSAMVGPLFSYGEKCLDLEQYDEAMGAFEACIALEPDGDEVDDIRFYLSFAQQMNGDYDAALVTATKSAEAVPDSIAVQLRIPRILYAAGKIVDATASLAELIGKTDDEFRDDDARADLFDAKVLLASLYSDAGEFDLAERWLVAALGEFPTDPGANNDLGYLWADQGKHLALAKRMIEAAVAIEPDNIAFLDSLGWTLYRQGKAAAAIEPLEKACAGEVPDGVILDHLGDVYQAADKPQRASDAWTRAVTVFQEGKEDQKAERVQQKIDASRRENR
jgi:tetratricopeptide (TPR) repeat protein